MTILRRPIAFSFALGLAAQMAAIASPVQALSEEQRSAGVDLKWQINSQIGENLGLPAERQAEAVENLLAAATRTEAALATYGEDPELALEMKRELGVALYYAAYYRQLTAGEDQARTERVDLLTRSLAALEPVMAAPDYEAKPLYEYREVTGDLFALGAYLDDPRWRAWSKANIQANRLQLADAAGDQDSIAFEHNKVAQALYLDGFLTNDAAEIAEAESHFALIPADFVYALTEKMREAIAEGRAPYAGPGEPEWE